MCIRAVNTSYFGLNYVPDPYRTQEIRDKAVDDN